MAVKKKGLGRGLDALLGGAAAMSKAEVSTDEATFSKNNSDNNFKHIPVEFLQRGQFQPRRDMDHYEIIAGERRWRASQLAGLDKVPCVIHDVADEAAIAMSLIENIQREDLNPIEEATALMRLQEKFELTHQQVAEAVGKSRTTVTNLLRLTTLSAEAKKMLEHGDLEMGHARAILTLDPLKQTEAARTITAKGLSVRQAEALVRQMQIEKQPEKNTRINPDVRQLQVNLSEKIGAPVMIQHNEKGKGKLVIKYTSLDELDGILDHIK